MQNNDMDKKAYGLVGNKEPLKNFKEQMAYYNLNFRNDIWPLKVWSMEQQHWPRRAACRKRRISDPDLLNHRLCILTKSLGDVDERSSWRHSSAKERVEEDEIIQW